MRVQKCGGQKINVSVIYEKACYTTFRKSSFTLKINSSLTKKKNLHFTENI